MAGRDVDAILKSGVTFLGHADDRQRTLQRGKGFFDDTRAFVQDKFELSISTERLLSEKSAHGARARLSHFFVVRDGHVERSRRLTVLIQVLLR